MNNKLKQMLSLDTIGPFSAVDEAPTTKYTKIGAGACGAVYAKGDTPMAFKFAKAEQEPLHNDYNMHNNISQCVAQYWHEQQRRGRGEQGPYVRVPKCHFFITADRKEFFAEHSDLCAVADKDIAFPTSCLASERIPPLPSATGHLLIDKYCAPRIKAAALADPANRDCLVRPYLGSVRGKTGGMFFSLRNFKLHLNQMMELGLDVDAMARLMAQALAVMHWGARTDARDVEFVLGSSGQKHVYPSSEADDRDSSSHGKTQLWLLDFNQVRPITLDDTGVDQAVEAFMINDPYYPRPVDDTPAQTELWKTFETAYMDTAKTTLGGEYWKLPRMFLDGVVVAQIQRHQKMQERGGLGQI